MSTTYQPKKRKRRRSHGFLSRSKTTNGRKVNQNRRRKARKRVSPV